MPNRFLFASNLLVTSQTANFTHNAIVHPWIDRVERIHNCIAKDTIANMSRNSKPLSFGPISNRSRS